ncbi:hypothetical protein [Pseudomonas fulva]
MVSVPEGFMLVERSIWTEQQVEAATACITRLKGVPGMRDCDLAMAAIDAAQCKAPDISLPDLLPPQQPHPDPIAWMVGTAFWWTKEEAERDAADTGLPIVGLGPMTDTAEVERLREEVEKQRRLKMLVAENLQNALANCSVYRYQLAEQSTLLQVGLTMINRGIVSFDDQIEYRQKLAALSASAEPSAPTWSCQSCQLEQPTERPCDACSGKTELIPVKS